jgi:dopamine beta-monooxygenase
MVSRARLLLLLAAAPTGFGYSHYRDNVPNGYNVPGSKGFGHVKSKGGGKLNTFGSDFQDAELVWTKTLCGLDSDGDGRSNGVELGDPKCVWKVGDTPFSTTGITNPGVPDEPPSGGGSSTPAPLVSRFVIVHGALLGVAWLVLAPLGILVAMLRKRVGGRWFLLHQRAFTAAGVLTVAGCAVAIVNVDVHAASAHGIVGLVLFGFVVVQLLSGFARPAAPQAPVLASAVHFLPSDGDHSDDDLAAAGGTAPLQAQIETQIEAQIAADIEAAGKAAAQSLLPQKSCARRFWEVGHKLGGKALLALALANVALGVKLALVEWL